MEIKIELDIKGNMSQVFGRKVTTRQFRDIAPVWDESKSYQDNMRINADIYDTPLWKSLNSGEKVDTKLLRKWLMKWMKMLEN